MSTIGLQNLTLRHGARNVLRDVNVAIESGEFIGLLGPNGAGKTTLLRAILGLIPPAAGQISVLGLAPAQAKPLIGYMPQSRGTMAHLRLDGFSFVAGVWQGQRLGLPWLNRAARREVDWALDLVGARELARRPLAETSGGERQRLLLAQALIGRPKLLLLDEPLISLDPRRQTEVVRLTRTLQSELGLTVVFSAHDLNPLLPALDRVLYLGGGQAVIGTVGQVITPAVLSRLYGTPIEVARLNGRIFVMAGNQEIEAQHQHV